MEESQPKITVYSAMSNTQSDLEIKMAEVNQIFHRLVIYTIVDFILSILLNLHEAHLFNEEKFDTIRFIIETCIITILLLIFFVIILFYSPFATKLSKKFYLAFAIIYFLYKLFLHIKRFTDDFDKISAIDLLFFFVTLVTIIPRVVYYYYMDLFSEKLTEMVETKKCEDHDQLVERLGNKMDRGQDTKWSENSLSFDREKAKDIIEDKEEEKNKPKGIERESEFKLVTVNTSKTDDVENNIKIEEDHFNNDDNEDNQENKNDEI